MPFDRLEARRAFAQPLERLIDGFVFNLDRRAPDFDRFELARIEGGHDVELGLKVSGWPFFELHVTNVGRLDRLDAAFLQRFADCAFDELVRDVVQDLARNRCFTTFGGTFPGRNPGSRAERPYSPTPGDLGVDHVGRDFDHQVLPRFVDVDELSFHWGVR